jgi:hypothetical protein
MDFIHENPRNLRQTQRIKDDFIYFTLYLLPLKSTANKNNIAQRRRGNQKDKGKDKKYLCLDLFSAPLRLCASMILEFCFFWCLCGLAPQKFQISLAIFFRLI